MCFYYFTRQYYLQSVTSDLFNASTFTLNINFVFFIPSFGFGFLDAEDQKKFSGSATSSPISPKSSPVLKKQHSGNDNEGMQLKFGLAIY